MATKATRKEDFIRVKQYITDMEGHKVGAVIDMEELNRLALFLSLFSAPCSMLFSPLVSCLFHSFPLSFQL